MKSVRVFPAVVLCLTACAQFAGFARASVVFDNFGPGDACDTSHGWALAGPLDTFIVGGEVLGARFTVTGQDTAFDSAELGLCNLRGANSIDVSLVADGRGLVSSPSSPAPGVSLETIHLDGAMPTYPTGATKAQSRTHPLLQSGKSYWLVADVNGDGEVAWLWNASHSTGLIAYNFSQGSWMGYRAPVTAPAFRINGATPANPVPEPGSLPLLASGGLGLLLRKRRKYNEACPSPFSSW